MPQSPFDFIILGALENPKIPSHSSFPRRRESTGAPPAFPCLLDSRLRGSDDETGGGEFRVSTATEYIIFGSLEIPKSQRLKRFALNLAQNALASIARAAKGAYAPARRGRK